MHQTWTALGSRRAEGAYPVLSWRGPVVWLSLAASVVLCACLVWDRALAARLTREHGAVEWLQVLLLLASAALALRWRRPLGTAWIPRAPDAAFALLFLGMVAREVDLDRWLLGRTIRLSPTVVIPAPRPLLRAVLLAVAAVLMAAVGAYCVARLRECLAEGARLLREPWGWLALAAGLLLDLTELLERPLSHAACCPPAFLEEGLELIASLWLLLAMRARALRAREAGP